jgi:ABC-type nickel/cobalt efflux system permease component RcnA
MKIVISVIVSVGAICIVIGLTLWILWRKRRNRSPYLLGHSVVMTTNSSKLNEVANIDSTSEIMPVSPNQCEENALTFVASNHDRISVMDGGFVRDSLGEYMCCMFPHKEALLLRSQHHVVNMGLGMFLPFLMELKVCPCQFSSSWSQMDLDTVNQLTCFFA